MDEHITLPHLVAAAMGPLQVRRAAPSPLSVMPGILDFKRVGGTESLEEIILSLHNNY